MEETLHPSEIESLRRIRGFIAKGINSRNGRVYQPIALALNCVICESGVMNKSPDGLTCGEDRCRDELTRRMMELLAVESDAEQKVGELEEKIVTLEALQKQLTEERDEFKTTTENYKKLGQLAKKACEVLKKLLPDGIDLEEADDDPTLGILISTVRELEEFLP